MKMTWIGWNSKENRHVLVNQFHGNFHSKTVSFRKIKSVFRDVKWCFNPSWGPRGLKPSAKNVELLGLYPGHNASNSMTSGWEMKWNESGFRPPLCTYRLNWARRTSWGWWDDWDDTVLQTQDSKFEPWRSEAEHATSRSRRFPTILTFTRGWEETFFVSFKPPRPGTEPRTLAW